MSKQQLKDSETVELKKSLAELKQGMISMAAILNKHQAGTLWFGVRNNGAIAGINANEKTLRDLFIVSFYRPSFLEKPGEETVQSEQTTIHKELFPAEKAVLEIIQKKPNVTRKELAARLNLSEAGVRYNTDKLQTKGILRRVGGKKAGRWDVIEDRLDTLGDGGIDGRI